MSIIDLNHYSCTRYLSAFQRAQGMKAETVQFKTALDLARYLSEDMDQCTFVRFCIEKKLGVDEQFKRMKKNAAPLGALPSFRAYRKKKHREINNSLQRAADGETLTIKEQQTIERLRREIAQSPIVPSVRQMVFYGMGHDGSMADTARYSMPHFLSTTLCIPIAIWHARRKAGVLPDWSLARTAVVMAITLSARFPAIFAHRGRPEEFELLFDCGAQLSIDKVSNWPDGTFEFVEATLHSMTGTPW